MVDLVELKLNPGINHSILNILNPGINHNIDELLVGIVTQIRLKAAGKDGKRSRVDKVGEPSFVEC